MSADQPPLADDLAQQPGAFRARARPVAVDVRFAEAAGTLQTLEGPVDYAPGDALVTGVNGERWPIPRSRFEASYHPATGTGPGRNGRYIKHPREVWAWRADRPLDIPLPQGVGTLHANPGDIVVQYAAGDCAVVQADIFAKTYLAVD
jgi:hypothetical protein